MTLELNLTDEDRREEGFKEYSGSVIAQRPLIVAANRIPMRTAHLMGMRILHPESDWMTNYFDCDDCPVYSSDGKHLKIGSRGELKPYEAYGGVVSGAVEFSEQKYQALPWRELKKRGLVLGRNLSESEAKTSSVWFELSQRNQGLLDVFVNTIYEQGKFAWGMQVYLDTQQRANAWMGALYVFRLDDNWRSRASGYTNHGYGRLVGIAPEALVRLEGRLLEEKGIQVDFVRALTEGRGEDTRKVETPVEVKSESGFQMERRYDIEIGEGDPDERYVSGSELASVLGEIRQGGKLAPEVEELILKRTKISGGEKNE